MVKMSRLWLSVFSSAAITQQAALLFASWEPLRTHEPGAAFRRSVTARLGWSKWEFMELRRQCRCFFILPNNTLKYGIRENAPASGRRPSADMNAPSCHLSSDLAAAFRPAEARFNAFFRVSPLLQSWILYHTIVGECVECNCQGATAGKLWFYNSVCPVLCKFEILPHFWRQYYNVFAHATFYLF